MPIGGGADGVAYDSATGDVFFTCRDSGDGMSGVVNIFHEDSPDKYTKVADVKYMYGARTVALDHFRSAAALTGAAPDPRLAEAVEHVRSRRLDDGTWLLDWTLPGRVWFDVDDGPGRPSRWVTLRAMRVLGWWDGAHA